MYEYVNAYFTHVYMGLTRRAGDHELMFIHAYISTLYVCIYIYTNIYTHELSVYAYICIYVSRLHFCCADQRGTAQP